MHVVQFPREIARTHAGPPPPMIDDFPSQPVFLDGASPKAPRDSAPAKEREQDRASFPGSSARFFRKVGSDPGSRSNPRALRTTFSIYGAERALHACARDLFDQAYSHVGCDAWVGAAQHRRRRAHHSQRAQRCRGRRHWSTTGMRSSPTPRSTRGTNQRATAPHPDWEELHIPAVPEIR